MILVPLGFLIEVVQYMWEDGMVKKRSPTSAAPPRRAKSVVSEPTRDNPSATSGFGPKPWMRHASKPKHSHKETKRINQRIEEAFEQIDEENWIPDSTSRLQGLGQRPRTNDQRRS